MHQLLFALVLATSAPPESAALNIPPIHYTHRTLANGLEQYSIRDTSAPTVAIHVWYD